VATKKQWHPVFAELLRPLVESHYEVETNMPVGDIPREADFTLLRRTRSGLLPAAGLWQNLRPWNVLELKGPTVSPRDEDLELLVEVGLGIHRRLNEEQVKQHRPEQGPAQMALWYLAHRLGKRLLRGWGQRVPGLQLSSPGIWHCTVLGRPVFLVSGSKLPVEEASLPLHLISRKSGETEQAVARLVTGSAELWERYGGWLASLHPALFREVQGMAKQGKRSLGLDLTPVIETMGMQWLIEHVGVKKLIEELGTKRFIEQLGGVKQLWAELTPEQRRELKRLAQE
jgi:hypothetical protein